MKLYSRLIAHETRHLTRKEIIAKVPSVSTRSVDKFIKGDELNIGVLLKIISDLGIGNYFDYAPIAKKMYLPANPKESTFMKACRINDIDPLELLRNSEVEKVKIVIGSTVIEPVIDSSDPILEDVTKKLHDSGITKQQVRGCSDSGHAIMAWIKQQRVPNLDTVERAYSLVGVETDFFGTIQRELTNVRTISNVTGLSQSTLYVLRNASKGISLSTYYSIYQALNIQEKPIQLSDFMSQHKNVELLNARYVEDKIFYNQEFYDVSELAVTAFIVGEEELNGSVTSTAYVNICIATKQD